MALFFWIRFLFYFWLEFEGKHVEIYLFTGRIRNRPRELTIQNNSFRPGSGSNYVDVLWDWWSGRHAEIENYWKVNWNVKYQMRGRVVFLARLIKLAHTQRKGQEMEDVAAGNKGPRRRNEHHLSRRIPTSAARVFKLHPTAWHTHTHSKRYERCWLFCDCHNVTTVS